MLVFKASLIAFDYKWNLRSIDSNSDNYEQLLSRVCFFLMELISLNKRLFVLRFI